jgi:serine/threonine protein kinase
MHFPAPACPMNPDPRNPSGTTIAGRYRVVRKLGAGGMGAVWLVEHNESLQLYALKTLHPRGAIERMTLERFLREARAAAALRSKHVVKVIDAQMSHVNESNGEPMPFIVMELLEGMNLEQLLQKQGALPPAQVVWILRQVARGLDVAHQKGIVHRDLKPENLFLSLDEDGEPVTKICDFGIAKLNGALAAGLMTTGQLGTEGGVLLGTPLYMSPEQARNSAEVVAESDQWAMGLIAFKALTGQEYFGDALGTSELFIKIFVDPFVQPTTKDARLPPAFDAWFLRACARDPKQRFASVGDEIKALADALGVAEGEPPHLDVSLAKIGVERPEPALAAPTATVAPSATPQPLPPQGTTPSGDPPSTITRSPTSKTHHPSEPVAAVAVTTSSRRTLGLAVSIAGALALVSTIVAVVVTRTGKESSPERTPAATVASTKNEPDDQKKDEPKKLSDDSKIGMGTGTGAGTATETATATANATATETETAVGSATASAAAKTPPPKGKIVKPAVTTATPPTSTKASGKPKGAPCTRSAECISGFCVAEECQ